MQILFQNELIEIKDNKIFYEEEICAFLGRIGGLDSSNNRTEHFIIKINLNKLIEILTDFNFFVYIDSSIHQILGSGITANKFSMYRTLSKRNLIAPYYCISTTPFWFRETSYIMFTTIKNLSTSMLIAIEKL